MPVKVVIVGAGPGGLISLVNFQNYFERSEVSVVCYERRDKVGGDWVDIVKEEAAPDHTGAPTRTNHHDWLQMHTPTVLYPPHPDYQFPPGTKLYPTRFDMYTYLKTMARRNNLKHLIEFRKEVSDIQFDKNTSKFSMKVQNLNDPNSDKQVVICDYVLLCNGHYGLPRKANFVLTDFTGDILYYHELTDATKLYGKRVLVVGSSWAAMDSVIRLNKPGKASSVHLSRKSTYPIFASGANLASMHVAIDSARNNTVGFVDGSAIQVDAIILCAGFQLKLPLSDGLKLDFEGGRYLLPLYKHLVHPRCPQLFVLGKGHLNALYLNYPQSLLIFKIIKGEFKLPSEGEMMADISKFQEYWNPKLAEMDIMTEEEKDEYFPLAEMELDVGACYHELVPSVPKMGPDYIRQIYYQFLHGIRKDCLNYKTYVCEFRRDPKNPKKLIPYLVPPTT